MELGRRAAEHHEKDGTRKPRRTYVWVRHADPPTAPQAILGVLEQDARLAGTRNDAPHTRPLAVAVGEYVGGMDRIDLTHCPAEFREAFLRHRDAWERTVGYLGAHQELSGEMHDLFAWLESDENPTAGRFKPLLAEIWSTWAEVERAMETHGLPGG